MGWICSPSETNCVVKFYSIAEDVEFMFEVISSFLLNLSPGMFFMIGFITVGIIVLSLFYSVKKFARNIAKNG